MGKTAKTFALSLILLSLMPLVILQSTTVDAQTLDTITINADGSVDPSTAPISRLGNTYTLTGNIYGKIIVRCFNTILDGAGYTLQGNGTGRGIEVANIYNASIVDGYYVTIKNFNLKNYDEAICVFAYWGNILKGIEITSNNITNSNSGVRLSSYARYTNNTVADNVIDGNKYGLQFEMAMEDNYGILTDINTVKDNRFLNNQVGVYFGWQYSAYPISNDTLSMPIIIYDNDFIDNSKNAENWVMLFSPSANITWNNQFLHTGNYWSDYQSIYSNASELNHSGIWDTSYVINEDNVDQYPRTQPVEVHSIATPSPISPMPTINTGPHIELFPTLLLVAVSVVIAVVIVSILLFRSYKKTLT
jgi:hypothetical protein